MHAPHEALADDPAAPARRAPRAARAVLPWLPLLLPPAAALVFVLSFARAFPLTDEWFYVRALRRLHDVDWSSIAGWSEALRWYPWRFNVHTVALPFLLYAPVAEATHYDTRAAIAMTLAAFAAQAWVYRATTVRAPWALLPVVLVLFCPSHYMEFLWGWQITVTLSVLFPLAGLALIDGIGRAPDGWARARCVGAGLVLVLLGVWCSAGAFFGFVAALLVVALAPIGRRTRAVALGTCALAMVIAYLAFMRGGARTLAFGRRELLDVCTGLGAALWGSPVGLFQFGLDARSVGGLSILVLTAAVVLRGGARRELHRLGLPLGAALMGVLCMISIAMARPYLGNWHVQYALPTVCGAYAAAYALWRVDRSAWSTVPLLGLTALLLSSAVGYAVGFGRYGPDYSRYTRSVEEYQFENLTEPGLPTPYPEQGDNDMGAQLFLFLAAHGHPLFAARATPRASGPLPAGARVFEDGSEVAFPLTVEGGGKVTLLTVALPGSAVAGGVRARIGGAEVRLWRVHPGHVPAAARVPDSKLFMAVLVPHLLQRGRQPASFEVLE